MRQCNFLGARAAVTHEPARAMEFTPPPAAHSALPEAVATIKSKTAGHASALAARHSSCASSKRRAPRDHSTSAAWLNAPRCTAKNCVVCERAAVPLVARKGRGRPHHDQGVAMPAIMVGRPRSRAALLAGCNPAIHAQSRVRPHSTQQAGAAPNTPRHHSHETRNPRLLQPAAKVGQINGQNPRETFVVYSRTRPARTACLQPHITDRARTDNTRRLASTRGSADGMRRHPRACCARQLAVGCPAFHATTNSSEP